MAKRIIDYPEATDIAVDDYVVLGSDTLGTRKLLASKIGGGGGGSDCVNPNYEWWANEDKTLVIRVQRFPTEINNFIYFRIYFNWFDINTATSPFQKLMQPPFVTRDNASSLTGSPFYKNNCQVYADCDQTDYGGASDAHGYIGFYGGTIRGWAPGLATNQVGKYRAIMESTDSGTVANPTPWEEPTFDPING